MHHHPHPFQRLQYFTSDMAPITPPHKMEKVRSHHSKLWSMRADHDSMRSLTFWYFAIITWPNGNSIMAMERWWWWWWMHMAFEEGGADRIWWALINENATDWSEFIHRNKISRYKRGTQSQNQHHNIHLKLKYGSVFIYFTLYCNILMQLLLWLFSLKNTFLDIIYFSIKYAKKIS